MIFGGFPAQLEVMQIFDDVFVSMYKLLKKTVERSVKWDTYDVTLVPFDRLKSD